ncbi:hypothetical protein G7046_g4452 [Stylonectria norvegica]|nr:hypothetical protein G7046_g4452 [Stylonectria norvegica]
MAIVDAELLKIMGTPETGLFISPGALRSAVIRYGHQCMSPDKPEGVAFAQQASNASLKALAIICRIEDKCLYANMLQSSRRPYVCWKCVTQSRNGRSVQVVAGLTARRLGSQKSPISTQPSTPLDTTFGLSQIPKTLTSPLSKLSSELDKRPLRERLENWAPKDDSSIQQLIPDAAFHSKVSNNSTRPQSTGSSELDYFKSVSERMAEAPDATGSDDADLAIVGSGSKHPGDLVEMKQPGSRTPVFGIYLGYFGDRNHFYASNGKWIISLGFSAIFSVSNFASAAELQPLLDMLPKDAKPDEFEELRREDKVPSRETGGHLIERMTQFIADADETYQGSLATLDKAKDILCHKKGPKYLSLFEIADILLPARFKKGENFPPSALYAVHTALYRHDFTFQPLSTSADCQRKDHIFVCNPHDYSQKINRVAAIMREYTALCGSGARAKALSETTPLGVFVAKARRKVLATREKRSWSPYGILSPSIEATTSEATGTNTGLWSKSDQLFVQYLRDWACFDMFDGDSRFHAYGSLLLRALDLYPKDAPLDQSTAWTLLQELDVIPSWEIPSRWKVRFPKTKIIAGQGIDRDAVKIENSRREDVAAGARKHWKGHLVFAIDAPSTMIIDDGVSLERTDNPKEYWLHVHTADPASGITPNSQLSQYMELIPENIYLPGHFQAMLPSNLESHSADENDYKSQSLVDSYSLAPTRKALTFSAKLNEDGDLLDYKIEPGVLDKVVYLDPVDVAEFCNEPPPPFASEMTLVAGTPPNNAVVPPNRPMTAAQDLDASAKEDLLTLHSLAEALKRKRLQKGAWPFFFPKPSVSVTFPDLTAEELSTPTYRRPRAADPYIKIGYESSTGCSTVSNSMVLAGEIAARWCADRSIPVPYRRDINASTNAAETLEYATKTLYPLIEQGIEPTTPQRLELSRLTGGIEISSTPGPYFMLGLDMYTKATSPLRRFSDLIVHWQIHAALAHERVVQRRLDPATDDFDEILPFTPDALPNTLSLLQMREKMARSVSYGSREWILIALVRAWHFEKTAPKVMRFTVDSRWRQGLMGRLDLFDLEAVMNVTGVDDKVLIRNVKVGDQFDVELVDVNVFSRNILVKAIKYLGGGESS